MNNLATLPYFACNAAWVLLVCGVGVFVGADLLAFFVEEGLSDEPTYPINIVELPSVCFAARLLAQFKLSRFTTPKLRCSLNAVGFFLPSTVPHQHVYPPKHRRYGFTAFSRSYDCGAGHGR